MSCAVCLANDCRGFSITHHDNGCKLCGCKVPHDAVIGIESKQEIVPGLKRFDKRPRRRQRQNWLQRKFAKHKRFSKAFNEFGVIWLTITSSVVAYAAGLFASLPGVPGWLPLLLVLVYAPYIGYQAAKWSEMNVSTKFQEKIDAIEKRIAELERS